MFGTKNIISIVTATIDKASTPAPPAPRLVIWIRHLVRLSLFGMVVFILILWPTDEFTPKSFDEWTTRISKLPEQVWYLLIMIIGSWATVEAVAGRNTPPPSFPQSTPSEIPDFPMMDGMIPEEEGMDFEPNPEVFDEDDGHV